MKLQDQVCSRELAEKLRQVGVSQKSLCSWSRRHGEQSFELRIGSPTGAYSNDDGSGVPRLEDWLDGEAYAAFTVAEFGEMLPPLSVVSWRRRFDGKQRWICREDEHTDDHSTFGATEADARAKMLVYLIENQLLPAPVEKETNETLS